MKTAKITLVLLFSSLVFLSCSGSDDECYDFIPDSELPTGEETTEATELSNPKGGN